MGHTDEAKTMHLPQKGKIEWNLNTWVTLGGVFVGIVVTSTGWGITYANMRNDNEDLRGQIADINERFATEATERKDRLRQYQQTLDGMQARIGDIAPLSFNVTRTAEQTAENKAVIAETNKSFGGKLDALNEGLAKLNTAVQVLSSKLDDIQDRPDKSIFKLRTIKP